MPTTRRTAYAPAWYYPVLGVVGGLAVGLLPAMIDRGAGPAGMIVLAIGLVLRWAGESSAGGRLVLPPGRATRIWAVLTGIVMVAAVVAASVWGGAEGRGWLSRALGAVVAVAVGLGARYARPRR